MPILNHNTFVNISERVDNTLTLTLPFKRGLAKIVILKNLFRVFRKDFFMYSLQYKGLSFCATFQTKDLCIGTCTSFAKFLWAFILAKLLKNKKKF